MTHGPLRHARPLLSLTALSPEEVRATGDLAQRFSDDPGAFTGALAGSRVALVFTAPSTRTRASFWSAATALGCDVLNLGAADLQVSTGETWGDTGAVLGQYLDAAVVRTNGAPEDLRELAVHLPATINALTYDEHPTQAIADLCALRDRFGRAEDLRLAYLGPANNTARSLAHLCARTAGMTLAVYSPAGAGFESEEVTAWNADVGREAIVQADRIPDEPDPVDAVYTARWASMGVSNPDPSWYERCRPFAVTRDTLRAFGRDRPAALMHDLPAVRDEEVSAELLDDPDAAWVVSRQAHHKRSAAAASLLWALGAVDAGQPDGYHGLLG